MLVIMQNCYYNTNTGRETDLANLLRNLDSYMKYVCDKYVWIVSENRKELSYAKIVLEYFSRFKTCDIEDAEQFGHNLKYIFLVFK